MGSGVAPRRCLVLGGAGPVGASLCGALLSRGWTVFCIDNELFLPTPVHLRNRESESFFYLQADVSTLGIESAKKFAPNCDVVFNLCGPARHSFYTANPRQTVYGLIDSTILSISYCKQFNSKLIHASSSELYGSAPSFQAKFLEESTINFSTASDRSVYAGSKFIAESILHSDPCVRYTIFRIFNVYGPNFAKDDSRVIPIMLRAVKGNSIFTVIGDGSQTRSFLFIDDLIDAFLRAIDKDCKSRLYNVGSPHAVSILDLWEKLSKLSGRVAGRVEYLDSIDFVRYRRPSIDRIRDELGWQPRVTLEEGLEQCLLNN